MKRRKLEYTTPDVKQVAIYMRETFLEKVRNGGGMRFVPMQEEEGGRISRETPKHNYIELEHEVLEVMA